MSIVSEEWRPVAGYEGIYEVSSEGRVRSLDRMTLGARSGAMRTVRGRVLKAQDSHGYRHVSLCSNSKPVNMLIHRIVAAAFRDRHGEADEVNHINGIKSDNRACNLEWVTHRDNQRHAQRTGLFACGERKASSKLTAPEVLEIKRKCEAGGKTQREIAREYGVGPERVSRISRNAGWRHILDPTSL